MDSINSFDIRLEKDVYYPGEPLNGVVIIDLMEPIKLRGIRVFLRGRARVQWKVLKSGESKTLKDDQYLLDDKALLWGRERQQQQQTFDELDETTSIESDLIQQQQTQILPKGLHELAFNFNLPPTQLPCSLETKAGTIRYYVKVLVDMPYASSPQGIKYFTLIGPHIDCLEEKYLSPLTGQDHKIRCQPCCRRGVVALRVILERSAYCCGEQIKLNLHLENRQECPTQICVKLIQNLEYRIDKGGGLPIEIKTIQSTALEWRSQFVLKHSQLNIDPNNFDPLLQLPTLPPTMIGFCRLIQLYYILKINVNQCPFIKNQKLNKETSTSNNNNNPPPSTPPSISSSESSCLEMDFPLTIATVPFREIHSQFYSVVYDFCGGHVETGKYISPEFRLGQVWDGRIQENENNNNLNIEEIVLYRPVYVKIIGEQQQTEKALASNNSGGGICRRQSTRIVGCSNNENNILTKQKEGVINILN
uniref:Arrestin C-terminal-like domain-containing protein n=1 Tax=Meloidogyne incognita TaxID=6306 RepID=A0A914MUC6_MELIC